MPRFGTPSAQRAYLQAGPDLYTHYFSKRDHHDLAALAALHTRTVISYDDHPLVRDLYARAECYEIPVRYDGTGVTTIETLFTTGAPVAVAAPAGGAA